MEPMQPTLLLFRSFLLKKDRYSSDPHGGTHMISTPEWVGSFVCHHFATNANVQCGKTYKFLYGLQLYQWSNSI